MGKSHYNIPNKQTYYTDRWDRRILYDSVLEASVARLCSIADVKFEPHVTFKCFYPSGKQFSYTVDFVFDIPQRFIGLHKYVNVLEVKGVLYSDALERIAGIEYCHSLKGYIATPPLINMWHKAGLWGEKRGG